jgi:hypothetical protein
MTRLIGLLLLAVSLHAQIKPSVPTPRPPKKGEERTTFQTSTGNPCGYLAHIDSFWYFYLIASPAEPNGWVSKGFDVRADAVKWGSRSCPKQGTVAVAK